jgi:hypothetical protein
LIRSPDAGARATQSVACQGEEGRVIEGHAAAEASIMTSIPAKVGTPSRVVTVPGPEWEQLAFVR